MAQSPARAIFCCAVLAYLSYGVYSMAKRGYADVVAHAPSLESVDRALRLEPDNAAYWVRRAELLDVNGRDNRDALERAAALNPADPKVQVALALNSEAHGDAAAAERHMRAAARASRLYETRWALANFYFRQGARGAFWKWARAALEVTAGAPEPVFQLCWALEPDAAAIRRRAIPPRRDILRAFAEFLLERNHLDEAAGIAGELLADAQPADRGVLLNCCERLIDAGRPDQALRIWNALCTRAVIPYAPLDPGDGAFLTDGAFQFAALPSGFGWRPAAVPGVSIAIERGVAMVSLSGDQPEHCDLLTQLVPLRPGDHELQFEYRTDDSPSGGGVRWRASDAYRKAVLAAAGLPLDGPEWQRHSMRIAVPAGVSLVRLSLACDREPGSTRAQGTIYLRAMVLK